LRVLLVFYLKLYSTAANEIFIHDIVWFETPESTIFTPRSKLHNECHDIFLLIKMILVCNNMVTFLM